MCLLISKLYSLRGLIFIYKCISVFVTHTIHIISEDRIYTEEKDGEREIALNRIFESVTAPWDDLYNSFLYEFDHNIIAQRII